MSERDIWISFQAGNPKVKVLDGRLKISSKTAIINKIAISGISGLDDLNKICQNLSRNIKSLHNVQVLTEKHKKDSILLLLFIPTEDTSSVVKMLCSFKESDWKETNIVFNKVEVIECLRSSEGFFELKEEKTEFPVSPFETTFDSNPIVVCPVCLEDLQNESKCVLTLLCGHKMHVGCLSSSSVCCPICRFEISSAKHFSKCDFCGAQGQLWFCLVCGSTNCERDGHSLRHFEETGHVYSQDLDTKEVWDYGEKQFASRLIFSDCGNKIVHYSRTRKQSDQRALEEKFDDKVLRNAVKFDKLIAEHSLLQREHYDKLTNKMRSEEELKRKSIKEKLEKLESKKSDLQEENKAFRGKISEMEKSIKSIETKEKAVDKKLKTLEKVNTALLIKQGNVRKEFDALENKKKLFYNDALERKKNRIKELKDEIEDLKKHLDIEEKLKKRDALDGGNMIRVRKQK